MGSPIRASMAAQSKISGVKAQLFQSSSTACRSSSGKRYQEQVMSINKDQVKGRIREAKGTIKEAAGKLVGNETLQAKGKVQKILGKAQAKYGNVKKDVKDATKAA
jgi:uncharacterized protein YjbJ (UPF0337 family)